MRKWFVLFVMFCSVDGAAAEFTVPVEYHTLDNGLKVVVSEDRAVPIATVAIYYGIGFRLEPKGRTGFAHLFEHMMFQGSRNLRKGEFISLVTGHGGVLNGSTSFDFTNYYETIPSHKVETLLWAEADRMRGLDITQADLVSQQGVVKNEVKGSVLNRPYGGFPWLDLPQLANENWYNAHNFYGDLDELGAATLGEIEDFFDAYYAPNNAVVAVAGDVDADQVVAWVEKYFGDIPRRAGLSFPDISEPLQTRAKWGEKVDPLAPQPALAWAYHVPERNTPDWYAMVLIDAMLLQGADSRMHRRLVQERGYAEVVSGGINLPRNDAFGYKGPMLWSAYLVHDAKHAPEAIVADIDAVVGELQAELVREEDLARAKIKLRSRFYDKIGDSSGLAEMLALLALFDDDPARINRLMDEFDAVTPELVRKTAREHLQPSQRSILVLRTDAMEAER